MQLTEEQLKIKETSRVVRVNTEKLQLTTSHKVLVNVEGEKVRNIYLELPLPHIDCCWSCGKGHVKLFQIIIDENDQIEYVYECSKCGSGWSS